MCGCTACRREADAQPQSLGGAHHIGPALRITTPQLPSYSQCAWPPAPPLPHHPPWPTSCFQRSNGACRWQRRRRTAGHAPVRSARGEPLTRCAAGNPAATPARGALFTCTHKQQRKKGDSPGAALARWRGWVVQGRQQEAALRRQQKGGVREAARRQGSKRAGASSPRAVRPGTTAPLPWGHPLALRAQEGSARGARQRQLGRRPAAEELRGLAAPKNLEDGRAAAGAGAGACAGTGASFRGASGWRGCFRRVVAGSPGRAPPASRALPVVAPAAPPLPPPHAAQ
jgi:hypothetical protein